MLQDGEPWMMQTLWGVAATCAVLPVVTLVLSVRAVSQQGAARESLRPQHKVPLLQRPVDLAFIFFFLMNFPLITYVVDLEQIVIADPHNFVQPLWPPKIAVDLIHWYGNNLDPVLMARPVWWKVTIWIDALFFGPFYVAAIWAFWKGRQWIRTPSIIYSSVLLTILAVILSEETWGDHSTPHWGLVMLLNLPWVVVPACLLLRMATSDHPFHVLPAKHKDH